MCRSFSFAAPKLWNSLPKPARYHDDLANFKSATNTYLFREHFVLITVSNNVYDINITI